MATYFAMSMVVRGKLARNSAASSKSVKMLRMVKLVRVRRWVK